MIDEDEIGRLSRVLWDEAIREEFYESALLHEPSDELRVEILMKLAVIEEERGNHTLAADRYEEMSFCVPNGTALYYIALHRSLAIGELQADTLKRALLIDPQAHQVAPKDERWEPWREQGGHPDNRGGGAPPPAALVEGATSGSMSLSTAASFGTA